MVRAVGKPGTLVALVAAVAVAVGAQGVGAAVWDPYDLPRGNLLENPGAEDIVSTESGWYYPGWAGTCGNGFYDYANPYPGSFASMAPPGAGNSLVLCHTEEPEPLWQVVKLSKKAQAAIGHLGTGKVQATVKGYIGGWRDERGRGSLVATFHNKDGEQRGESIIVGPVGAAERNGVSGFVFASKTVTYVDTLALEGAAVVMFELKVLGGATDPGELWFDNLRLVLRYVPINDWEASRIIGTELRSWADDRSRCGTMSWANQEEDAVRQGFRVALKATIPSLGVHNARASWYVENKETVVPLNKLARTILRGCH